MWPPMPASYLFWRTTMAMAFQRVRLLMRRSMARSPGYGTSASRRMVFTYGVLRWMGRSAPALRACWVRRSKRNAARSGPSWSNICSSASIHSDVSRGFRSTTRSVSFWCMGYLYYNERGQASGSALDPINPFPQKPLPFDGDHLDYEVQGYLERRSAWMRRPRRKNE